MCKNCWLSGIFTFFLVYFIITAISNPIWNVWIYSLIITILVFIAVISCPILNKEGTWKCCVPGKAAKKIAKKKKKR